VFNVAPNENVLAEDEFSNTEIPVVRKHSGGCCSGLFIYTIRWNIKGKSQKSSWPVHGSDSKWESTAYNLESFNAKPASVVMWENGW
jgi:hypothetical protein